MNETAIVEEIPAAVIGVAVLANGIDITAYCDLDPRRRIARLPGNLPDAHISVTQSEWQAASTCSLVLPKHVCDAIYNVFKMRFVCYSIAYALRVKA